MTRERKESHAEKSSFHGIQQTTKNEVKQNFCETLFCKIQRFLVKHFCENISPGEAGNIFKKENWVFMFSEAREC